ncbi:D-alanyl-D-alanine carboxypeptidase [Terrihabitans soli]|uniref:serine-type D-Ala-D-Ala carboxypeptidase n=1 Tax=Terrihabitans soli TaxID=708113 RepID=A0A6S6QVH9_9HYPH|nr:D-alanyl-D-alanine carboxypeptidase family protein [Terrihabitans soli]BCJ91000.1 D-alanyl-D-alanine carboxypeptidase [Terrihabitans soli]
MLERLTRRIGEGLVAAALVLPVWALPALAQPAVAPIFETDARQAILIDSTNDAVLYTKEPDAPFAPASLAKLMTLAVTFDEIKRGFLTPTAPFTVSQNAWRTGGAPARTTTMFARVGSEVTVKDLIRGTAIVVANDGAIALAEGIAGSEEKFAERMNAMAKEMGLTSSVFVNSTGLPAPGARTSVRDLARIAQWVITRNPDMYPVFSEPEIDFGGVRQLNRNPLMGQYEGTDGMLIGSIAGEGHIIVASAVRGGKRLIAVLGGLADEKVRLRATSALLDWGFTGYIDRDLFAKGDMVATAQVFGGTQGSVKLVAQEKVTLPVPKDGNSRISARVVYRGPITAPVSRGDRIGVLRIWRDNLLQREVPLIADENIEEGSLFQRAFDAGYEIIAGALHPYAVKLFPWLFTGG